jgi:multicomponent Na+:H+ antiporter subunit D
MLLSKLPYLMLFLPLILSAVPNIIQFKKCGQILYFSTISIILICCMIIIKPVISSSFVSDSVIMGVISIGTEYKIDMMSLLFLFLIFFANLVIFIYNLSGDYQKHKKSNLFYSIYLLNAFAIVGVLTTNYLFNLYLFIEIYLFTFYALISSSKTYRFAFLSFKDFINSAVGSIIILLGIVFLYTITGSANIDDVANKITFVGSENLLLTKLIFVLLIFGIALKFFGLWIYISKCRTNIYKDYLSLFSLFFVKVIIGVFVLTKVIFVLFDALPLNQIFHFDKLLFILANVMVLRGLYVSYYKAKNLTSIAFYNLYTIIGFILITISLNNVYGLEALFIFVIEYVLVGLLLLIFSSHLYKVLSTTEVTNLWFLRTLKKDKYIPLACSLFLKANVPLSLGFWGFWFLIRSSVQDGFFKYFSTIIIIGYFLFNALIFVRTIGVIFFEKYWKQHHISMAKALVNDYNRFYIYIINALIVVNILSITLFYFIHRYVHLLAIELY